MIHHPAKYSAARRHRPLLPAALLFLSFALLAHPASAAEDQAAKDKPRGMPVEAVEVLTGTAVEELDAVGTLQSNESVVVATEVAGRVKEISFAEGQRVAAGDVLVRLDAAVRAAELDRARASLGLSEANFRRAETLHAQQAISERERDEAYAQWQLDQANVRLAEALLDKTVIRAPFAGRLGLRRISPGAYLNPGAAVANLDDIDPIKVDFRVPEGYADRLRVGQDVAVAVDAVPGRTFTGTVYAIDPQVDVNGRSVLLRARVDNEDGTLRPGMFARVGLVLARRAEALFVPEEALLSQGEQQLVYTVVDGKVAAAPVEIGLRRRGQVEIRAGLEAGDTVVTGGQLKVRPGMPVTVLPATAGGGE